MLRRIITSAGTATVTATVALVCAPVSPAAITPTFDATDLGDAVDASDSVSGAGFTKIPPGYKAGSGYPNISPAAVSDTSLAGFATAGPDYAILSTGDPRIAERSNDRPNSGYSAGSAHFQGVDNFDATVLRIDVDVPAGANCLSFDYRFLSEEFDEYVGGGYNDTFIAQLDRSDWYAAADQVSAPGNFAASGGAIDVDSAGAFGVTADEASGTTYDAATQMITARTAITPGAHSIYLSIFDQGDPTYDSAVFVDNLKTGSAAQVGCESSPEDPSTTPPGQGGASGGSPANGGAQAQTGQDSGGGSATARVVADLPGSRIAGLAKRAKSSRVKAFGGSARGTGVVRVQIALLATTKRATASKKSARAGRCIQMNARQLMFQSKPVAGKCSKLEWITVEGTDNWQFRLKRKLPKGSYTLYSRAVTADGSAENDFSTQNGNKVSFKVY